MLTFEGGVDLLRIALLQGLPRFGVGVDDCRVLKTPVAFVFCYYDTLILRIFNRLLSCTHKLINSI